MSSNSIENNMFNKIDKNLKLSDKGTENVCSRKNFNKTNRENLNELKASDDIFVDNQLRNVRNEINQLNNFQQKTIDIDNKKIDDHELLVNNEVKGLKGDQIRPSFISKIKNNKFLRRLVFGSTLLAGIMVTNKGYSQEDLNIKKNTLKQTTDQFENNILNNYQDELNEAHEFFETSRIKEQVKHISGLTWEFNSLNKNGEYPPSFNNSLFLPKKDNLKSPEISGGFSQDLNIYNRFGTFVEETLDKNLENLLLKYKDRLQVNDHLKNIVKNLSKDKYIFIALSQFFEDGGVIKPGRGYYNRNSLEIEFGYHENPNRNTSTLYHELLHYIFDKKDADLFESSDTGGADHYAISPLEERFNIINAINQGNIPLSENIRNLYGFTSAGKAGDEIKKYLEDEDLLGLNAYLLSDDFYRNYVHSSMVEPLSSLESNKTHRTFSLKLSNGNTLRIMENYSYTEANSIKKNDFGSRDGIYIDVKIKDIEILDIKLLNSYVSEFDIENIKKFLKDHKDDSNLSRGYILTPDQINDIAHLNANNAILLENSFNLAIEYSKIKNIPFEKVFAEIDYKDIFKEFIFQFTSLEQEDEENFSARKNAREISQKLIQKIVNIHQ